MMAILDSCDVFSFQCLEGADHQRCEALKGGGRCAEAGWHMLNLSVIILFKSVLHVFCSLFSAHNSSAFKAEIHWRFIAQII